MMVKAMIKKLTITLVLTIITAVPALSYETFDGTIKGADCVVNHTRGAVDVNDPHIALERDFVLVTSNGDYFFMPNLRRLYKELAFKKNVRVIGKKEGSSIFVNNFKVQKNDKYHSVWDYTEELKMVNGH